MLYFKLLGNIVDSLVIWVCMLLEIWIVFESGVWNIGKVVVGLLFNSECNE